MASTSSLRETTSIVKCAIVALPVSVVLNTVLIILLATGEHSICTQVDNSTVTLKAVTMDPPVSVNIVEDDDEGRTGVLNATQQLLDLTHLSCQAVKKKAPTSHFLHEDDPISSKNYTPREVVITGCVEETSYCPLETHQCLPVIGTERQKKIELAFPDSNGVTHYCHLEVLEHVQCRCQEKATYQPLKTAKAMCVPLH